MTSIKNSSLTNILNLTVLITGLGYFIDMFDMFLFNMLRVKSLTELGLSGNELTNAGLFVSNCQWAGLLIGAYLSGLFGDKFGRKKSLFISIILYSSGSIASAFVQDIDIYGLTRLITAIGLAGELGMGLTLISESMSAQKRGYGVMVFIVLGFLGVVTAGILAEFIYWRYAYIMGGAAGILLLITRIWLSESPLYSKMAIKSKTNLVRGGLKIIFSKPKLLKKYIFGILFMTPSVFVPQILWTLSPEIGKSFGIVDPIKPNVVLLIGYSCVIIGDILACLISEYLKSRKSASLIFLLLGTALFIVYIFVPTLTLTQFYILNGALGITFGAWLVGSTWITEHFATNIRSTAATTIPNFARGLTILMNVGYGILKVYSPIIAVSIIGFTVFTLACISWYNLSETYGKDLNYFE